MKSGKLWRKKSNIRLLSSPAIITAKKESYVMKRKRIAAMAGLILIGLFYAATLILTFLDNPFAKNCLMAALFITIVAPVILYGYMIFIGARRPPRNDQNTMEDEETGV